jgi:hypothetical protein
MPEIRIAQFKLIIQGQGENDMDFNNRVNVELVTIQKAHPNRADPLCIPFSKTLPHQEGGSMAIAINYMATIEQETPAVD